MSDDFEALLPLCTGPAPMVNKVLVTAGPVVRISFLEAFNNTSPQFRSSVCMSRDDAAMLVNLLSSLLEPSNAPKPN